MAGEAAQTRIDVLLETGRALAQLRKLQSGLSTFHQSFIQGSTAATRAQQGQVQALQVAINKTGELVAVQKTVRSSTEAFTSALERNKLTLREYARFSAAAAMEGGAGKWMQKNLQFTQRFFAQEKDILRKAIKDRVRILQSQWIRMTPIGTDAGFGLQITPLNNQMDDLISKQQMAAQRMQLFNKLVKDGSTKLLNFGKNTQWAGRQLMVGFTIPLVMLGASAAKTFREMEEQTVKFRRVYGDIFTSEAETQQALKNIQDVAKEFTKYGIAAVDTVKMAAEAAAAGFAGGDLQAQVIQANKLAVLGQIEQQQALETTISLQNAFGVSAEELANKINFLNAVENQTVLSIDDITQAVPRVGPIIEQLGGSVEDLAFFLTAMKEGGVSAAQGANALKSGLASLINPSDKAAEKLAEVGINIKGIIEANQGDLRATVVGFARALQPLSELERSRAIEQVFGKFQFARISALFNNITKEGTQAARVFELIGYSTEELAILTERELGKVEESVGVKFQKTLEELKLQLIPLGKTFLDLISPILKFAGRVAEFFTGMGEGVQKLILGVGLIAPTAIMTFGLLANFLAQGINGFRMLFVGIASARKGLNLFGGGLAYSNQQELTAISQAQALGTVQTNLSNTFAISADNVGRYAAALRNATAAAKSLAASNPQLFVGGAVGAGRAVKRFARGTSNVKYYSKGTDTVPAMLTPGEAVIPAESAQNPANKPIIQAMIAGKEAQGFADGDPNITQSTAIRQSRLRSMSATDRAILRANERKLKKMLRDERFQDQASAREKQIRQQQLKSHQEYVRKEDLNRREMSKAHAEALRMNKEFDAKKAAIEKKQYQKMVKQEKVRSVTGKATGGLFAASMVAGMAGAPTGVTTGLAAAGTLAMLGPALLNPYVAAAAALTTVVGGLYLLNKSAKDAAKKQSQYVDSVSATNEKMKELGILTNKIGASEIMGRRRQGFVADRYTTGFERGKTQFGAQFMESEVGAGIFESFKQNMVNGSSIAAEQMALQLSAYISDGIMTAEQAHSVASQIGIELNNSTLISQISGRLLDIVGPSGENILKDPLGVRIKIIEGQQNISESLTQGLYTELTNIKEGFGDWRDFTIFTNKQFLEGYASFFTETDVEKTASAVGAMGIQNLEIAVAQQDAISRQYETQIQSLQKQKEAATSAEERLRIEENIAILEAKRDSDLTSIRKKTTDILNQNNELLGKSYVTTAMMRGAEAQVREKYKDQAPMAEAALAQVGRVGTTELQLKLTTLMGAGVIDPGATTTLLNLWDGAEDAKTAKGLSTVLTVALEKHDPGKVTAFVNSLGGVENKDVARRIIVEATEGDPEQFDRLASTIALLQQMAGKEVNFSAFFDGEDAYQRLLDLSTQLEAVEQIPTPITKRAIAQIDVDGNSETQDMGALLAVWDQWGNLDDETKKTVIQEYITVYNTILEGDIDAEIDRRAAGNKYVADLNKNSQVYRDNVKKELAAERTMQKVKQDIAFKEAAAAEQEKKNAAARNSMFDDLLKKLKLYNQFTVNAIGGTKELMKLFGKGKNIKGFMGVQQKLRKAGANQPLLDFVASLGAEELQREYPKLVRITKKGKTVLTEYAKGLNQALPTAAAGEYVEKQRQIIQNTDSQVKAFSILQKRGLTSTEILKILEDAATTAGIAAKNIKGENLNILIANTKNATKATKELEDALKKAQFEAKEEAEGAAEKLDEAFEFQFLQIEKNARQTFESVNKMSPEKMEIQIEIAEEAVEKIQEEINKINEEISLFDRALDLISRQEEDINNAYEEKIGLVNDQIDALNKVQDINEKIAQQQQQQVDLADAVTKGDISAAAKMAQELRATSAQSAFDRMREGLQARVDSLEVQRQKALDSIVAKVNGKLYTRKEIEKTVLGLNDEIYKIETERLNPKQKEIDAQKAVIDNYNTSISRAQSLLTINGLTKTDWEFIKNYVDAANKNADTLITDIDAIAASSFDTKTSWAAIVKSMTDASGIKIDSYVGDEGGDGGDQGGEDPTVPREEMPKIRQKEQRDAGGGADGGAGGGAGSSNKYYNHYTGEWVDDPSKITPRGSQGGAGTGAGGTKTNQLSLPEDVVTRHYTALQAAEEAKNKAANDAATARLVAQQKKIEEDRLKAALESKDAATRNYTAQQVAIEKAQAAEAARNKAASDAATARLVAQQKKAEEEAAKNKAANDAATARLVAQQKKAKEEAEKNKAANDASAARYTAMQKAQKQIPTGGGSGNLMLAGGGIVKPKYFANGSLARGTDIVPAMLTPGEFVVRKYAVQDFGLNNLNKINDGSYNGGSVYNYNLSVNVKSDANANDIAKTVIAQIKQIDSQRIRNQR